MNKYVGNPLQTCGVEELKLIGGKGDGIKLLHVRNGKGLDFFISVDRCSDISRLTFKGDNMGYFSPCGYVSPQYYDRFESEFLKSFTAGFFTTCGLTAVGAPCVDDGEELPLHGNISNVPCDLVNYEVTDKEIIIKTRVTDASLFGHKLKLERTYTVSLEKNEIHLHDTVTNFGTTDVPHEILYHCNMGYPLLSEAAELTIPAKEVLPRNEHAKEGIADCLKMEVPQAGYEEMCYYHKLSGKTSAKIYNKDIGKGLEIAFDADELKCFTEWKMMGETEYVLGLEPGNCYPDGRNVMREQGILDILKPEDVREYNITFKFFED